MTTTKTSRLTWLLAIAITALTALPAFAQKQKVAVGPQLGHSGAVTSIRLSPDGKQILSGSIDGTVKLWDTVTGRNIKTVSIAADQINSLSISSDGKRIVSGSWDGTVILWDAATGKKIKTFAGPDYSVCSVAFSSDGMQIVSGAYDDAVKLWDVATGREIRTFSGHTRAVKSVSFSPDGKQIVSGSNDQTIKLWDVASGREIRTFVGHTDVVNTVAFSPDGKQIVSGASDTLSDWDDADKTVRLWDIATGREIRTFEGHTDGILSVCFSPDGKQIVSGSMDGTIKLWDIATGRESRAFSSDDEFVTSVSFSPDGKQVLSGSTFGSVKLWDIATGGELGNFSRYSASVHTTSFSPDGKQIVSGSYDNTLKLWDVATGREIRTFEGHTKGIRSACFSPDGKQIVSGAKDETVKLWDVATSREIRTFEGHTDYISSVAFSPDGKQIVSGSNDGTVKLWDVATGREMRAFEGHTEDVWSVSFSPDGKQIVSGSFFGSIKLWDTATGREIRTIEGAEEDDAVESVSFSPNGKQIVSSSFLDNTIKLWDVETGKLTKTFTGHTDYVWSVCFSPDGKQILSSSHDQTIKLWNANTGKLIKTLEGHMGSISSVAFSPDGKRIVSGSYDGTTRLWDASSGKEIACFMSFSGSDSQLASATRGLTVETQADVASSEGEWLSIAPDGFYQASPRGDRYINVRVNDAVTGIDNYRSIFYNPDVVQARLQGKKDPASKAKVTIQKAASFAPPQVTIQSPVNSSTTDTAQANLSVTVTSQKQPIQNIKILVNGRLIGRNELAAIKGPKGLQAQKASLTVTGKLKSVNFDLPITLDPGRNTIEVVAFNGYSESPRLPVEVTWNAPAGTAPALPNLWLLAVGVNNYNDNGINNLNFCVADAKGVIDSLKTQEGQRYGKVNALLIADGESITPTAANIKQNLNFLDQAGERDVVLLFLAGHGVSNNAGKFLFLPGDVRLNTDKTVNEANTLSDGDIVKVLDRAGNLLVFIDACQSGGVDNDRLVRSLMDTNAFVFTSSRGNELSQEKPELGHGVFTYSIMDGLKGAPAAKAQGSVTVLSLSGFVSQDVPKRTGGAQNPKAYSLGFYDFPMAIVK